MTLNAYQMGEYLAGLDPWDQWGEPQWGDPDYDYGLAEDGTPNPPPCIVDGAPLNTCKGIDPISIFGTGPFGVGIFGGTPDHYKINEI